MSTFIETLFNLSGRIAVVTGASRGIGQEIADALASSGACVYGIGRSDTSERSMPNVRYRRCDLREQNALSHLTREIVSESGKIDILVNAAGITLPKKAQEHPIDTFNETVELNLTATYRSCLTIRDAMSDRGGSIINVTSIGAHLGFPQNPGYIAAKGGVSAMTRALALDFGADAIRVNNLVPGYIHTSMTRHSYSDPDLHRSRSERTILGRWGQPHDLTGAALFLASDASLYITGIDLVVDGGWSAKGL